MAPFNGLPTHSQQVALALAPKIAAPLSIMGSTYIVVDCCRKRQRKTTRNSSGFSTYHRLMIGLSLCDICMSIGMFTSTWPMPEDTPNVWGAAGTVASCEAIGFLEQMGVAAVMYNGSLSIYYLLRIRLGWPATKLAKAEPYLHGVPVVFALMTAIVSLSLNLFNSGLFDCWIAPYPQGCEESWRTVDGSTTCVRGNNASLYIWIFDLIPKWSSIILVTINMFLTHQAVLRQEKASLRFSIRQHSASEPSADDPSGRSSCSHSARQRPKPRLARRLARQSYLYVGALYLTYIPVIITRATELAAGYVYYEMLLTISITLPLQGLWNVMVYLRPQYLRVRDRQKRARQMQHQEQQGGGSANSKSFLQAVSEVVRDGALNDEEEGDDDDCAVTGTLEETESPVSHPPAAAQNDIIDQPPLAAQNDIIDHPPAAAQNDIIDHPPAAAQNDILDHPPAAAQNDIIAHPPAAAQDDTIAHPPAAAQNDIIAHPPPAAQNGIIAHPPPAAQNGIIIEEDGTIYV